MRILPRRHLLEIWRGMLATSLSPEGEWIWGGRDRSDSMSDAEQLLCLMLPATEVPWFRLEAADETDDEVLATLEGLGDAVEIPRRLARICLDYLRRYTVDGAPSFAGGRLAAWNDTDAPTAEQLQLDVVESYALSIRLTLAMLGFAGVSRRFVTRDVVGAELEELQARAGERLTAAMIGLLRSYCVNVMPVESTAGEQVLRMVNQSGLTRRRLVEEIRRELRGVAADLRDLTVGIAPIGDLRADNVLFECGWSWGPVEGAPEVVSVPGYQRPGYALSAPYLYFTGVALDSIVDLFSERTRILGLLDEVQQRLATALQLRWDLTQRFWSTLATFGAGQWPLEDIPWHTTDAVVSEYFSLLVTSIAIREVAHHRDADVDLGRVGHILTELAIRGRVTRRPLDNDHAIVMHHPGLAIELEGATAGGPRLSWLAADYAPLLLKRMVGLAGLVKDPRLRADLLGQADEIWQHLLTRRIGTGPARDLWDQPARQYPGLPTFDQPSWHHTYRVVETLVILTEVVASPPPRSEPLTAHAGDLLSQAEHLYAQEMLHTPATAPAVVERLEPLSRHLDRARGLIRDNPARATAMLIGVLQQLDGFAADRIDG
jgi:hypothetical protein